MKWKMPEQAPEYHSVIAQARVVIGQDDFGKEVWSPWIVVIGARCGDHWEMPAYWAVGSSPGRQPRMKVRRWTEIPEAPPVPVPDKLKTRVGALERRARDEELRRQGWRMKSRRPEVTQVCRILVAATPDYGPYREREQSVFDGHLPPDTRAWRPN